jgi:mRNA-degrading endonuclease HigB of HigAB toxin-antitoxin module
LRGEERSCRISCLGRGGVRLRHRCGQPTEDLGNKVLKHGRVEGVDLKTFRTADPVGNLTVLNIKGNAYRLIVYIDYGYHKVFVRNFLTHAEYSTGKWKHDDWF